MARTRLIIPGVYVNWSVDGKLGTGGPSTVSAVAPEEPDPGPDPEEPGEVLWLIDSGNDYPFLASVGPVALADPPEAPM